MTEAFATPQPAKRTELPASAAGIWILGGELAVHRLGFGAMRLPGPGVWGEPADPPAARAVLRRAVELGVNLIDTADFYGPEVADRLIVEALHPYPADLVIATKVGIRRGADKSWQTDAHPERLRAAVEGDLRRLRLERLDLVYLRLGGDAVTRPSDIALAESLGALADLRTSGKVRHVGMSNITVEQLREARSVVPIVAVQNLYNLTDRSREAVLDACRLDGIAFVPYFPLAIGSLARAAGPLAAVAEQHGVTAAQVALAWLLARLLNTDRHDLGVGVEGGEPEDRVADGIGSLRPIPCS